MKLIIVRHGETDRNANEFLVGHSNVPLNDNGKTQAQKVAQRLAGEHIDTLYSSTLTRAKETAQVIAAAHPHLSIRIDPELRERDAGEFAHRPVADRKAAQLASGLSARDWKPAGGESMRDLKLRTSRWFDAHCRIATNETIVVVSHGLFLYSLLECAIEDGADVEKDEYRLGNAAVTILDIPVEGKTKVIHLNDISHLTKR